jgi:hypothetical protein
MRGASRASYAELRDRLDAAADGNVAVERIGDELFAVTRLLDSEHGLRRALADPTKPSHEKAEVARRLLHGKVSAETEELVAEAAAARWASPGDLADAVEQLAIEALTLAAQAGGRPVQVRPPGLRPAGTAGGADRARGHGCQAVPAGESALGQGQLTGAGHDHAGPDPPAWPVTAGGA